MVDEPHTTIGEEKYWSDMPDEYVLEDKKQTVCDDGGRLWEITSNEDAEMLGVAAAKPSQQDKSGGTLEF